MGQYERQRRIGYKAEVRNYIKIGRNDLCLCGSGTKYKNCCAKKNIVFVKKEKENQNE